MTPDPSAEWSLSQNDALATGLAHLTKGEFLLAHDRFEDAWREAILRPRLVFHGLAQLAASYHQLTLGRGRAAVRTWHKARAKLTAADALSPAFAAEVDAFFAQLGLSEEGPRFVDLARVGATQRFPLVSEEMLHSPSA